jgi:hypothetical protein
MTDDVLDELDRIIRKGNAIWTPSDKDESESNTIGDSDYGGPSASLIKCENFRKYPRNSREKRLYFISFGVVCFEV